MLSNVHLEKTELFIFFGSGVYVKLKVSFLASLKAEFQGANSFFMLCRPINLRLNN